MLADAKQSLLKLAIGLQSRGFHEPIDPAVDHDRDFFRNRGRDADILLDDEDADIAFLAEIQQDLLDLLDNDRSESLGRFVHDEQMRVEQQRARNRQHLLLAAGQLIAAIAAPLGEPRKRFVDARNRPLAAVAAGEPQMFVDRDRGPQPSALRHVAEAEARDVGRASGRSAPRP